MLQMIDADTALQIVLNNVPVLDAISFPVAESLGHILAEAIYSDRDYPPFNRAMMDGFAVKLIDAGKSVVSTGVIAAGSEPTQSVKEGTCLEIMTGASCPAGAEAVVQYEKTNRNGETIELPSEINPLMNIASTGKECAEGSMVLDSGDEISPLVIAVLATFGIGKVKVYPKPSITIITTGDELLTGDQKLAPTKIRDSNQPMLASLAREAGITEIKSVKVDDSENLLLQHLQETENTDIVVLSGGVSMGKYDFVPKILREFGVDLIFHKVSQKPGKPLLFGKKGKSLYFGLPGNPLACHMCFHRYIAPAIRKMQSQTNSTLSGMGVLTETISVKGTRLTFQLVHIENAGESEINVYPLIGKGSADIFAPATANGYISLSPGVLYEEGTKIEFEYTGVRRWQS